MAAGKTPDGLLPEEPLAHRAARQLPVEHQVDDNLYHLAEERFGRQGVLDLVILVGIYQTVCGLLNAFETPAPTQDHDDEGPSRGRLPVITSPSLMTLVLTLSAHDVPSSGNQLHEQATLILHQTDSSKRSTPCL